MVNITPLSSADVQGGRTTARPSKHQPGTWLIVAITLTLLTVGCIGSTGPTASEDPPGTTPEPEGEDGAATNVSRTYAGFIYYRSGVHHEPVLTEAQWEGDPLGFCFEIPEDTRRVHANLTWEPPNEVGLQIRGPDDSSADSWFDDTALVKFHLLPPLNLTLDHPDAGTGYAYVGPGVIGGAIDWSLTLTWIVEREDVSEEETVYEGEPCGV